ncbi:hypothetical protein ALC53_08093 [Atta colombica]|uniref:Uncharacterized protein n=1 Tax=Atta colombica TaxID=520822 RepID=A0A151I2G4_9HYME|nr:hypothetical protein ALC53_08093 [Atta colombica]
MYEPPQYKTPRRRASDYIQEILNELQAAKLGVDVGNISPSNQRVKVGSSLRIQLPCQQRKLPLPPIYENVRVPPIPARPSSCGSEVEYTYVEM